MPPWARRCVMLLLLVGLAGCARYRDPGLHRIWLDWNTLGAPAAHWEKRDHLPYRATQVDYFRWMYNASPAPGVPPLETSDRVIGEEAGHGEADRGPSPAPAPLPLPPAPAVSPPPAHEADSEEAAEQSTENSGEFRLNLDGDPGN